MMIIFLLITTVFTACLKQNDYTQCTTTASLAIAQCSAQVKDTPNLAYYSCLCAGNKELYGCYSICPDDNELLLQKQQVGDPSSSAYCKTEQEMLKNAPVLTLTSTSSVAGGPTSSSKAIALSVTTSTLTLTSSEVKSRIFATVIAKTSTSAQVNALNTGNPPAPWGSGAKSYSSIIQVLLVIFI